MQGFHSESKVWVWDYDTHTAHLLTKTDCRQSGRRWEQLQVGKSEKCDHTPLTTPCTSLGWYPAIRWQMSRGISCTSWTSQASHPWKCSWLSPQTASYSTSPRHTDLCNRSIPVSGLEWNDDWKTNQNIRGFPYTPPSSIFCTALPHLQNYSRCRCGRNKQNRVATAV